MILPQEIHGEIEGRFGALVAMTWDCTRLVCRCSSPAADSLQSMLRWERSLFSDTLFAITAFPPAWLARYGTVGHHREGSRQHLMPRWWSSVCAFGTFSQIAFIWRSIGE